MVTIPTSTSIGELVAYISSGVALAVAALRVVQELAILAALFFGLVAMALIAVCALQDGLAKWPYIFFVVTQCATLGTALVCQRLRCSIEAFLVMIVQYEQDIEREEEDKGEDQSKTLEVPQAKWWTTFPQHARSGTGFAGVTSDFATFGTGGGTGGPGTSGTGGPGTGHGAGAGTGGGTGTGPQGATPPNSRRASAIDSGVVGTFSGAGSVIINGTGSGPSIRERIALIRTQVDAQIEQDESGSGAAMAAPAAPAAPAE